jgi:hypothetical protein
MSKKAYPWDYTGETPLHAATQEGNNNVAKLLRRHGGHE